ncbi:MAG TPA: IS200/IS605 family transposase [Phycisphaerae bacterium]|nr:IS200/IS605 family transposase [Phycisphaerae bacterium]HRW55700.1 IS200/IS605 family transposase [Phycisphaerae bacterium]
MPQSLAKLHIHLVFSTKDRQLMIDDAIRAPLHGYMAGILDQLGCCAVLINSVGDHVHVLFDLSRERSISDVTRNLKTGASKWIKTQGPAYRGFAWQAGYGAFAVSVSNIPEVRAYIENQQEHHRTRSFQDEFRLFLRRHNIEFDEQYVWD